MQVTEIANEGLKRAYKIVVPAATLTGEVDSRLTEMSKTAVMPGFRRGKVPVTILRKQYGQALFGEAVQKAVQDSVGKTVEDNGLRPALQPRVDVKAIGEDKDLEFDVTVEIMPEIGDVDFSGIELERLKVAVEDKAVDEALERIAAANKEQKDLAAPRPAAKGDMVKIDFTGYVDGTAFPNGAATDYTVEIGSASLIPGFEDQLIGASAGEDREVKVTFPADYGNKELAGKEATFKVTVKEIRELVARPIDDELAKASGFDNLEAMRKAVRERIEQDYAQVSRTLVKRKLLDQLAERHKFSVPAGLVDLEFEGIWKQVEDAKAAGQKVEGDEEKLKEEYRGIADRRVRLGLLLAEVGRKNNIEVSAAEINQAVFREAQRFQGQERQVLEFYQKNPEMRDRLRAPIFEDKTIDFALELAKVTDKPVSPDDLLKAAREAEDDKADAA
ncbi:trigger factor [Vineibacter terrae]|uniref:trigger factor n=1 Tax=Vineibacter terrae TaxID=2586908 RepID=UPI002E324F75|nr:trigger factor [Vineibacter terrae]HEX2888098.1 trigger factor [Vineibacter terrae]